ncbi:MAG: His/Gly/Thr/Pro-type tRNA ligase C-terminal domain-containing protein, partial [Candidatus Pacebacteria bacterium]|nr:His/Gly/Thr/Pro-type tRNA ligase C-terminal domain-containing protein [Candidatus Paceibacterota bacterium]
EMAGVYSLLPLGLRTLERINTIVREEMNAIGGQELLMSVLQSKELWEKTNRWSDDVVDNWFKSKLKAGGEVGLGFTQEEPITRIFQNHVHSYADLPKLAYHIQWKYRNEERAKSGILRGREFLMKDLYTFARTTEEHDSLYESVASAYGRIFARLGIGDRTYRTFASGGVFSKYSHEYQCVSEVGEDVIYVHEGKRLAVNKEVLLPEVLQDLGVTQSELVEHKAIEVGNIFTLGTRFSEPLGLNFTDADGVLRPVLMGSYGFGCTRMVGVLAEVFGDAKGLVWPDAVAPFQVHLVDLSQGNADIKRMADELYADLLKAGVEVLYEDRDARAGEKFADSDLIGIPYRIIIGKQSTADSIEVVRRSDGNVTHYARNAILSGTYATRTT